MSRPDRPIRKLANVGLSTDDLASLRSLLGLLDGYLKSRWELCRIEGADLVLARLDGDPPARPQPAWPAWVGCAHRPRHFAGKVIHRPLRGSELLAVLNEIEASAPPGGPGPPSQRLDTELHLLRLRRWPDDHEAWPDAWLRVLAALSGDLVARDMVRIRTGVPADTLATCLDTLHRTGLLEQVVPSPGPIAAEPRADAPWRRLVREVGRRLRFS